MLGYHLVFKFSDVPGTSELRCTPWQRHLVASNGTTSGHLDILVTLWVRLTFSKMYPLVETSSDQEQYYIRSAWHLQSDVSSPWHLQKDIPSHCVIICVQILQMYLVHLSSDIPAIEASGGQEWYYVRAQYYVRSSWHLIILWVRLTFSQMSPSYRHLVMKTGTKLQGIMGSNCCHLLFNY